MAKTKLSFRKPLPPPLTHSTALIILFYFPFRRVLFRRDERHGQWRRHFERTHRTGREAGEDWNDPPAAGDVSAVWTRPRGPAFFPPQRPFSHFWKVFFFYFLGSSITNVLLCNVHSSLSSETSHLDKFSTHRGTFIFLLQLWMILCSTLNWKCNSECVPFSLLVWTSCAIVSLECLRSLTTTTDVYRPLSCASTAVWMYRLQTSDIQSTF